MGGFQNIFFAIKCGSRNGLLRMEVTELLFYESRPSVTK